MKKQDFNQELKSYRAVLKQLAARFTRDQDEIQDLIQETFIRAFKYMDQFHKNPRVISWLFVIMRNIYINQYRRNQHSFAYHQYAAQPFQQVGLSEPFTEAVVDKKLMLKEIQNALNHMPPTYKELFNDYIDGYKYKELADIYGVPEGTIKSRIHHIRKNLIEKFQH